VLVVRLSALGDVLFGLETVASLKAERPDVRIDFLVEDRHAAVLATTPSIETVRTIPRRGLIRRLRAVLALRRERYHAILDLHGLLKSGLVVRALRARHRLGFAAPGAREGAHIAYRHAIALPNPLPHRAERGLYLLRALGLRGESVKPDLGVPRDLHSIWTDDDRPRVVLHPGASAFAAFKRWPIDRFRELAARLARGGVAVAVSFGPGESDLADALERTEPTIRRLDGRTLGLLGLAHAMRGADLVVAADTGPLHIAAAVGTKVVALFGPKDPSLYGPRWHDDHTVLFHDVPCRPCKRRTCATPQCVLGLSVDRVASAIAHALASPIS
jgi:ADP-heptose:LPS heptosyltransferase